MSGPRRLTEQELQSLAGSSPDGGWVECWQCGEAYAKLEPSGQCADCNPLKSIHAHQDRARTLNRAGVPSRFTSEGFQPLTSWPKAVEAEEAIDSWQGDPTLLTLLGPTDTGKTTMAVELLWRQDGRRQWVTAGRIPSLLIRGANTEWERFTEATVLLVDELGRGHNRDGWEYVYAVVGERYNWLRSTILTTNLSRTDLEAAHPALYRRLQEGWIVPLSKGWRSRV